MVTDPKGGATVFMRDLQDRVVARQNIDGSRQTLAYEASNSRVHSITDALGQSTLYTYNRDDTVGAIAYANALVATPAVSFSYDASYRRLVQMIDGSGTTSYAYGAIGA